MFQRKPKQIDNPRRTPQFFKNRGHLFEWVDVQNKTGLEIGAHDLALVEPHEGKCDFADFRNFDELCELADRQEGHNREFVMPVRYDLRGGYDQITDAYEWIGASHVVEHVPDLARWFQTLARLLKPGGVVFLVVPDKRFIFDRHRRETNLTDVVVAHREGRLTPSFAQVFDHYFYSCDWQHPQIAWAGGDAPAPARNFQGAMDIASRAEEAYEDAHCSVFTPESFAKLMHDMHQYGLSPLRLDDLRPTHLNELDFTAILTKP